MKRLLYFIAGIIFLSACNHSNKIEITGTTSDPKVKTIVFSEQLVNGVKLIDSVNIGKKGNFKIKIKTETTKFYQLSVSKNNFITLLIEPGEDVNIDFNSRLLSRGKIEGSKGSLLVQEINNQLIDTKNKLEKVVTEIEKSGNTDKLNAQYAKIVNAQRDSSITFIVRNVNSLASIVALYQKYDGVNYVLYKNKDIQFVKIVAESLVKKYPNSEHVKTLIVDKDKLLKKYEQALVNAKLNKLIDEKKIIKYPEIILPNTKGDSLFLSKTKGKYILLNFWASWNEQSVKQNLILKDIYKKYHSKGFEIYQVSLDTKKENWERAIKFDQLSWINVIDLNGRMSYYAKLYNVRTLPTSFLINPEGDIVMTNPSKKQLISTFDYNLK